MTYTPAELASDLEISYRDLWQTLGLLEVEELDTAQFEGCWTPQSLLAHVAFWDGYQLRRLQAASTGASGGRRPAPPIMDNEQRAAADSFRLWDEVVAEADDARLRLVEYAAGLSAEELAMEFPEGEHMLSPYALLSHMVRHTREHEHSLHCYCGSMRRWRRADLRRFFDRQYCELMDSVAGLSEDDMLQPSANGPWSIRDVLAHVLGWNEYCHLLLDEWPSPRPDRIESWAPTPGETEAALNVRLLARFQHLDLIGIADGLVTYHRRMLRLFDGFTDAQLDSTGQTWAGPGELSCFFYEIALHEVEHAEQIWRRRVG